MPLTKKSYGFSRKRKTAKKYVPKKRTPKFKGKRFIKYPMYKSFTLFPPRKFMKMKYADYKVLSSMDTAQTYTWRGNSLYDPDFTGVGFQPQYFDTLCNATAGSAPYNKYKVHGAKYKIRVINGNSSGNSTGICAVRLRNADQNVSAFTSANAVQVFSETQYTKWQWVTSSGNDGCMRIFKGFMKTKTMYGVRDLDDDSYSAQYSTNPVNEWYIDANWITVNASGSSFNLQVAIEITYFVEFFDRNSPNISP